MLKNEKRDFEYDAFISYRHEEPDITIAKKLILALEGYSAPFGASKNGTKKISKIFRDREELPATDDLSESIKYALQNSRFLIVICSPHVRQKPQWVENEIECFSQLRGKQYIQTLLIEGEPEEAFPDSLLFEKVKTLLLDGSVVEEEKNLEFLAADIRPDELKKRGKDKTLAYGFSPRTDKALLKKALKLLKTERLRCLAPMLGCKFDDLYRRHMRRTIRNTVICSAAAVLLLGGFLAYAMNINSQLTMQIQETDIQRREADRQAGIAKDNEEKAIQNANEATQQRNEATLQRNEAQRQAELARINEDKAIVSANEALMQRENAERQAEIAKINEEKAVASADEADKQTKIAITEKDNAQISQSLFLADLSKQQLENGDRVTATLLALKALPTNIANPDRPLVIEAEEALRNSTQKVYEDFIPQQHIKTNTFFKTVDISQDNLKLVTASQGQQYACVWDVNSGKLIRQLEDDSDNVLFAKFSPDGSKIVTGSWLNVIMWDAETGEKLFTFVHGDSFFGGLDIINFSPDGSKIVVASEVFDVATGKLLTKLDCGGVETAKFSPDGSKIVTSSLDSTVTICDVATGKFLSIFIHNDSAQSAEFSPDGSKIVSASEDKTAAIWDVATEKLIFSLKGHSGYVESASFSPDGTYVLTASSSEAYVWNVSSGKQVAKLAEPAAVFCPYNNTIITTTCDCKVLNEYGQQLKVLIDFNNDQAYQVNSMVIFSRDGSKLIVLSGKHIMVWQTTSASTDFLLDGLTYKPLAVSPDDSKILTTCSNTGMIWDTTTGDPLTKLEGHTDNISSAVFSPDGSKVITVSDDWMAIIWDVATGKIINQYQQGYYDQLAQFSPDSSKVLITSFGTAIVWDLSSDKQFPKFDADGLIITAKFSPDGSKVLTAVEVSGDNTAKVWDASTGKLLTQFEVNSWAVVSAEFSPDGSKVVIISWDSTVIIWDVVSGKLLTKLEGYNDALISAKFSPDGSKVVTASWRSTAIIWDAATGKLLTTLEGHIDSVKSADFSPDGNKVITASNDKTSIIWDVATGKPITKFDCFNNELQSAVFNQDGTKIIATSDDNIIMIKEFKSLKDVMVDAHKLTGGHELTDIDKKDFYLE